MAIGVGTLGDYTPSYGNGLSPAPGFSDSVAGSAVGTRSAGKGTTRAPAVATYAPQQVPSSANGGCGEEPARKQVGPVFVDVDPAYSKTWHACMAAKGARELASAKAAVDAASDCGDEPAYTQNAEGKHFYSDPELGPYWAACRAAKAAKASPPIVPGKSVIVPAGLATGTPPPTPGRGSSSAAIDVLTAPAAAVAFAGPLATPPPAAVAATFGGHVEAPDAAWIAGGVAVLLGLGWLLHKKGVF